MKAISEESISRTVLHPEHLELSARMAPFGGYEMPIQYSGILAEHQACRSGVVVFDTCHMGEFLVCGEKAVEALDSLLSCNIASLKPGRCRYGLMLNEDGGVIDDLIVYCSSPDSFMLVVNSSTREGDAEWLRSRMPAGVCFEDISEDMAKIDVQGPESAELVASLLGPEIKELKYFGFGSFRYGGADAIVSRTGYTGELGYEVYLPSHLVCSLWREVIAAGALPAGLGARDTLRLEMGMPLYGHELTEKINAAASGMSRALSADKAYVGSSAVREYSATVQLVPLLLDGSRAARAGDRVMINGDDCGVVTSGSFAPSIGRAVALGYVDVSTLEDGAKLSIKTARSVLTAQVASLPFYKDGTARVSV